MVPGNSYNSRRGSPALKSGNGVEMDQLRLGVHIWVSVLIVGTLWRILSYHLIASSNESLVHLGRAMAQQY